MLAWAVTFFGKNGVDQPRLSAELLLAHVLGIQRIRLYTDFARELAPTQLTAFKALIQRAQKQEPIAYLTGHAHFFNLDLVVTRDVLIPRPDTETLVEHLLQSLRADINAPAEPRILDLCTGSGCIALALAKQLKAAVVVATDLSPQAADVARTNAQRLGLSERVNVRVGDLFGALDAVTDAHPFDFITVNPPYIPAGDIANLDVSVREFEPHTALDGGPDGLAFQRRLAVEAKRHLKPGGTLYTEIQFDQGPAASQIFQSTGWSSTKVLRDMGGRERIVVAKP